MLTIPFVHAVDGRTEHMITAGIHAGILYTVISAATFRSGTPQLFTLQNLPPPFPFPSSPVTLHTSFPHFFFKGRNEAKTFCVTKKKKNTLKQKANPKQLFF